ncbi:hypothetical protein EVAR_100048_1 [Eumeta japonica]|uniref:Uncharacterized protein n=1 Tax=Eumeta variegata TaxID=151549 RepID=A0A4C1ZZ73_EUMVA|nr:hypothetical protein EVAR_100048_1 [Eumeta japonica]
MDQDRGYNNYYSSRNSRQYEESSNWRRGNVNWDSQWPTDRYSNSDYYGYTRSDTPFNNYNQSSARYEEDYSRNSYELDPRTMEFDRLVELLHPKFMSEYLNKILTFLKSNNTEICFPHIAPYKEAFLVRIASDHKNLECPAFDETCQNISRSIRDFLYKNSKLFVWSHSYESGKITKNTADTASSPNVILKSSSSDAIDKDSKHKQSRLKKKQIELVSTDFKIQAMKTILDFIKDDSRSLLQYPDLSEVQANFLYTLLSCYDKPEDGAEKSLLLTPLVEALKIYSLKYQFRINKDTNDEDCRFITLEKTLKGKSSENNFNDSLKSPSPSIMDYQDLDDWNTDVENSDATDHRSDGVPDFGGKLNKNQRKLRYLFDQVTTDFKMTVLQKSLDYIEDNSRSSVQFLNLTIHESRFLKCLNSFPLSKKSYFLIEKQCVPLIMKLRRVLEP